jgi:uncharacterized protein (DUF1330 family)
MPPAGLIQFAHNKERSQSKGPQWILSKQAEMAAYWVGAHEIVDPIVFQDHLRQVVPPIERFGGRYLTRTGNMQIPENAARRPDRVVIVKFPDRASLDAWHRSPEYQPQRALQQRRATRACISCQVRSCI